MAISDTQKVDYLFKKIGFGISKTDTSTVKSPSNETIASPLILRGDIIWQQGASIPGTQPSSTTGVVTVYSDANSNTVECSADSTSTLYRTWKTNLTDWISPEYGSTYQVKVYLDNPGAGMPQSTGTRIFPDGTGNNDEWYFDYASGVLNFIGTNLPTQTWAGKSIYVVGARYVGQKGLTSFPDGLTIGNINLSGNNIEVINTDGNLSIRANGTGYINTSNLIADSIISNANIVAYGDANITGNTVIGGNLTVNGDIVGFSANTITMFDSLLYIATNNTTSDLVDIGFVGHYNNGSANLHTGVVRDAITKEYYIFDGYSVEPDVNDIDLSNSGFNLANLNVGKINASTTTIGNIEINGNVISNTNGDIFFRTSNSNVVNFDITSALVLPVGDDTTQPTSPVQGMIRFSTETDSIEYYNGTSWVTLSNAITNQQLYGDGTTTTFPLDFPATEISLIVNINGTIQIPGTAYNVVGQDIVFVEAPHIGDVVDIRFLAVPLISVVGNTGGNVFYGNTTYVPPQALGPSASPSFANLSITEGFLEFPDGTRIYGAGNISLPAGAYGDANVASYLTGNVITGNVFATAFYYANGAPFVGGSTYSNANVTSYLSSFNGNIIPSANVAYSLGDESHWWTELWVSSNTIYIGGKPLSFNPSSNVVTYNNQIIGGAKFTEAIVAPVNPTVGDFWYDTDTDVLYQYLDTGTVNAWIDITGPVGVAGPEGLQGPQGPAGNDGTSVIILGSAPTFQDLPTWGNLTYGEGFIIQATGNLAVYDGSSFQDVGQIKGPKGDTGDAGVGVNTASVTDGNLIVTLSNSHVINAGNVTGPQGPQGIAGNDGTDATNYLNFGNITANANLNMVTGTLTFAGYNGVVVDIESTTANIGLAGNVVLTSITSKFAEPVITGNIPSSYTPDWNSGSIHNYTAIQNFTLNAPVNMPVGASMTIVVTQDNNGNRSMTANSYYKFASNIKTLSTGANSVDMMNFVRTGDNTYLTVLTKGYA
jgi:hypothetical protein